MKITKITLATVLGLTVITGMPQGVFANTQGILAIDQEVHISKYVKVFGEVAEKNDGQIFIKNTTNVNKEILLNISNETIIIDAVSGLPVPIKDIKINDGIYAYIGQAMTSSLPPMSNAKVIIVNIPQDFKVPSYIQVQSLNKNDDGSITITSEDGTIEATLNSNTQVFPYLTKNIVTIDNINVGSNLFLWESQNSNETQTKENPRKVNISKCLIAPSDIKADNVKMSGWHKENNNWYYFNDDVKSKGWILDNNKWYYLNNEGVMQTGWFLDNGKWYYLNLNGDMAFNTTVDGYKLAENGVCI